MASGDKSGGGAVAGPSGGAAAAAPGGGNLDAARRQVDEVQNIMRANVEKVLERDGKLSHLEQRADRLHEGTEQFQRNAVRIKRKQFWENTKMKIIIGVVISVIVIIIIVWIAT